MPLPPLPGPEIEGLCHHIHNFFQMKAFPILSSFVSNTFFTETLLSLCPCPALSNCPFLYPPPPPPEILTGLNQTGCLYSVGTPLHSEWPLQAYWGRLHWPQTQADLDHSYCLSLPPVKGRISAL